MLFATTSAPDFSASTTPWGAILFAIIIVVSVVMMLWLFGVDLGEMLAHAVGSLLTAMLWGSLFCVLLSPLFLTAYIAWRLVT